jgi:ribosomal protein S18 acetylase RimI-like enzyme
MDIAHKSKRYHRDYSPEGLLVLYGPKKDIRKGSRWMLADENGYVQVELLHDEKSLKNNTLYIEYMEIKKHLRGRGFGAILYKKTESFAKNIGAAWIQLDSELDAVEFWRRLGFQKMNYSNYKDKICMIKSLS